MARKPGTPKSETQDVKAATPKTTVVIKRHKSAAPAIAEADPDPTEISRLAYSYWVARNYQPGSQVEDWFRAEKELRAKVR